MFCGTRSFDYSIFLLLLMKYVICLKKKHLQSLPLSIQEAMTISLRIYFAPTLFSNSSLSKSPGEGSNVFGYLKCFLGTHVPGPGEQHLRGLWCALEGNSHPEIPCGAQNLNDIQTWGTLTPSIWHTQELFFPQCDRSLRWAFKVMDPL